MISKEDEEDLNSLIEIFSIFLSKFIERLESNEVSEGISIKASVSGLASVIAHEVKTPLQFMLSKIQVMKYKYDDIGFKDDAILLENELNRVSKMVHELLDITKFTVDKREFPLGDLKVILEEVIGLMNKTLEKKSVKLISNLPNSTIMVRVSPVVIKQVIMNLVNNAIYALNETKNKEIEITLYEQQENSVIVVKDNGIGIKEENIPFVFKKGFSTKLSDGGTGLGLYAVKLFVKSIGGSIDIFSEENIGTSFVIKIPLQN